MKKTLWFGMLVCLLLVSSIGNAPLPRGGVRSAVLMASLYDDEFNGSSISSRWNWVREAPTYWKLGVAPGALRIITLPVDIWQMNNSAPLLLQPTPTGDFSIETEIRMSPTQNYQQAGLVIYGNDDNYVRLTYGFFDVVGFEFGQEVAGSFQAIKLAVPARSPYFLKISKKGKDYQGFYSRDGATWSLIGQYTGLAFTPQKVGLLAFNAVDASTVKIPADFNYFRAQLVNTGGLPPVDGFLDLPFAYSGSFATLAQGNTGTNPGRVNSWFDHNQTGSLYELTPWQGDSRPYLPPPPDVTNPHFNCKYGISCYGKHTGIDFQKVTVNEKVLAAAPGKVLSNATNLFKTNCPKTGGIEKVRCGNLFGNQVWIDHGNGYATLYAHLDTVDVPEFANITDPQKQPLGTIGDTGNSGGAHLHLGLYYDFNKDKIWEFDEVIDPYGWSGSYADPWTHLSRYLWKYSLSTKQAVDSSGGQVASPSGAVQVTVPPRVLTSSVTLEVVETSPIAAALARFRSTGRSFWLRLLDAVLSPSAQPQLAEASADMFPQPIIVTISYKDADLVHLNETGLKIVHWDPASSTWVALPTQVDTARNIASAQTAATGDFDLQAPLLCENDDQEPNDTYYTNSSVPLSTIPQLHSFDNEQDDDWYRLDARTGWAYTFETGNLAAGVDTILEVYGQDGTTRLAADQNGAGGLASKLVWTPSISGTYYLRVSQPSGGTNGCSATYSLSAQSIEQRFVIFLPVSLR